MSMSGARSLTELRTSIPSGRQHDVLRAAAARPVASVAGISSPPCSISRASESAPCLPSSVSTSVMKCRPPILAPMWPAAPSRSARHRARACATSAPPAQGRSSRPRASAGGPGACPGLGIAQLAFPAAAGHLAGHPVDREDLQAVIPGIVQRVLIGRGPVVLFGLGQLQAGMLPWYSLSSAYSSSNIRPGVTRRDAGAAELPVPSALWPARSPGTPLTRSPSG